MTSSDNETSFDEFKSALEELPSSQIQPSFIKEDAKTNDAVSYDKFANANGLLSKLSNICETENFNLKKEKLEPAITLLNKIRSEPLCQIPVQIKANGNNEQAPINAINSDIINRSAKSSNQKPSINIKNAIDIPIQTSTSTNLKAEPRPKSPFKQQVTSEDFVVHIIDDKSQYKIENEIKKVSSAAERIGSIKEKVFNANNSISEAKIIEVDFNIPRNSVADTRKSYDSNFKSIRDPLSVNVKKPRLSSILTFDDKTETTNIKGQCFQLIVKRKQYVKELLGGYIVYSLLYKENEDSQEKFLCDRRYSEFYVFHQYMVTVFPCYLIPKLTEKNLINKLQMSNDSEFEETRVEQLSKYLNYINSHELMKAFPEFVKFLNDQKFDNSFFNYPTTPSFPITESVRNATYSNKLFNALSYIGDIASTTIVCKKPEPKSSNEKRIQAYLTYFEKHQQSMEMLQSQYTKVLDTTKHRVKCHEKLKTSFFEMKDLRISDSSHGNNVQDMLLCSIVDLSGRSNPKNDFEHWYKLESDLLKIISKLIEKDSGDFKNKIEHYISQLVGVNDLIQRYYDFMQTKYEVVKSVYSSPNPRVEGNVKSKLKEESTMVEAIKLDFEEKMIKEINSFLKSANSTDIEIQKKFMQYLNWENNIENCQFEGDL